MIKVFEPSLNGDDIAAVQGCLVQRMLGPGRNVKDFEDQLADKLGYPHCICVNSGTTALMLSLLAVGVEPCGNVAFPSYTMLAGANAAKLIGADVCLREIDPDSLCMAAGTSQVAGMDAVIHVRHNGVTGNEDTIAADCDNEHVPLISDCCQALGYTRQLTAKISVLSFSVPKLITTGQGGAVLTTLKDVAEKVRGLADHGGNWRSSKMHDNIGGNFRMPDYVAALGVSQMRRFSQIEADRWRVHSRYLDLTKGLQGKLRLGWCPIYQSRDAFLASHFLKKLEIESILPYRPLTHNAPFKTDRKFPEAEKAWQQLLYLPGHIGLKDDEIRHVVLSLFAFEKEYPQEKV